MYDHYRDWIVYKLPVWPTWIFKTYDKLKNKNKKQKTYFLSNNFNRWNVHVLFAKIF